MAKCYRAKLDADAQLYSESEMRIFMQNIALHLHNISMHAKKAKLSKHAKSAYVGVKLTSIELAQAVKKHTYKFYKSTFLPDVYAVYFSWWLPKIYNFAKILVLGTHEVISDFRYKRKFVKLKSRGKAPVIISLDYEALTKRKGNRRKVDSAFHKVIDSNQKAGGVLVINSEGSYQSCKRALKNYKGKNMCISAYNGAFVAITDGDNGFKIINDKHLPEKSTAELYAYLSKNENKELLKDFYMIVEGKSDTVGVVDFYSGKVKGFKDGKFTSNPLEVESIFPNAYNIKFVPKNKKEASANTAGTVASVIASVGEPLKSILNDSVNVQFTRNGSVCLVPKGCSKFSASQMIADAYGLDRNQVLTMASSTADVCEPVEIEKISAFLANGGKIEDLRANVQNISPELIKDTQHLCILSGFVQNDDISNLRSKFFNDITAENLRILQEENEVELQKYVDNENAKLKEIADEYRLELESVKGTDEESEKKRAEIKQNLEYAVSIVNNKVELKRNELNERKVAPVLDLNNFEAQNIFQFSRKVLSLSNNEFTKPLAEASVAPAPTAEVAPTATM